MTPACLISGGIITEHGVFRPLGSEDYVYGDSDDSHASSASVSKNSDIYIPLADTLVKVLERLPSPLAPSAAALLARARAGST
ncbi:hypothetical protein EON65_50020, partial [archaeon]